MAECILSVKFWRSCGYIFQWNCLKNMEIKKFINLLCQLTTALRTEGVRGKEFELNILERLNTLKRKGGRHKPYNLHLTAFIGLRLHMALRQYLFIRMKAGLIASIGLSTTCTAMISPAKHTESCCIVSGSILEPAIPLSIALQGTDRVQGVTIDLVVTGAHAAISKGLANIQPLLSVDFTNEMNLMWSVQFHHMLPYSPYLSLDMERVHALLHHMGLLSESVKATV